MEAQKDVKYEHAPKSMKKGHSKRDWFFIQTNARCHYKLANVSLMCNNNSFDEDVRYFFQTHWHRDWLDKKPSKIFYSWGFSHDWIGGNPTMQINAVEFQIRNSVP